MTRAIVPVAEMNRRLPEHGRIRIGEKKNGYPSKLTTFRFTSQDKEALEQIAELYGGVVEAWKDGPRSDEYQVKTTSKSIRIALPPDPLGGSPVYELWSGGGCLRRCDGEQCEIPTANPDGAEMTSVPCRCVAEDEMKCKPKTRLTVIIRGIKFGGGWRLESGGWNAMQEMPGMVDMIQSFQQRGIVAGLLTLSERKEVKNGQTKKFVVPGLALEDDVETLASGATNIGSLGTAGNPARPELTAGAPASIDGDNKPRDGIQDGERISQGISQEQSFAGDVVELDSEIVDAEIVEEEGSQGDFLLPGEPPKGLENSQGRVKAQNNGRDMEAKPAQPQSPTQVPQENTQTSLQNQPRFQGSAPMKRRSSNSLQAALVLRIKDLAAKHKLDDTELRHAFATGVSHGATDKTSELDTEAKGKIMDTLDGIDAGEWVFLGLENGSVKIRRPSNEDSL